MIYDRQGGMMLNISCLLKYNQIIGMREYFTIAWVGWRRIAFSHAVRNISGVTGCGLFTFG